jgi:hypothetical protein
MFFRRASRRPAKHRIRWHIFRTIRRIWIAGALAAICAGPCSNAAYIKPWQTSFLVHSQDAHCAGFERERDIGNVKTDYGRRLFAGVIGSNLIKQIFLAHSIRNKDQRLLAALAKLKDDNVVAWTIYNSAGKRQLYPMVRGQGNAGAI